MEIRYYQIRFMNQSIFIIIILISLFPQCLLSQFAPDISIYPSSPDENDTLILTCSGETGTNVISIEEHLSISGDLINIDVTVYTGILTIMDFWRTNDTIGFLPTGSYSVNLNLTICTQDLNFGGFFRCGITKTYHYFFDVITEVILQSVSLPNYFTLQQNYPNPFNPSTTIKYALPQASHVSLSVFNTLGQRVSLLVDGKQEAGYHEVNFNASSLTSGVYFYRLQASDPSTSSGHGFVETKKLILIK